MIVYIAGKMRGLPDLGRAKFEEAEAELTQKGYIVLNPAILPVGMPSGRYMPICMAMLEQADAIYLLDGWQDSKGAKLEKAFAEYQGKKVIYQAVDAALSVINEMAPEMDYCVYSRIYQAVAAIGGNDEHE